MYVVKKKHLPIDCMGHQRKEQALALSKLPYKVGARVTGLSLLLLMTATPLGPSVNSVYNNEDNTGYRLGIISGDHSTKVTHARAHISAFYK